MSTNSVVNPRWRTALTATVLSIIAAAVSAAWSWIPSFWGDEAASVMSAERPVATLWPMLTKVDAVHGTYYALLHLWGDIFGLDPFWARFPSALAIGFATAGIFLLARLLGRGSSRDGDGRASNRLGILTAIAFMVIPRTTYMGGEARSYALSTMIAVWLTLLLVWAIRRPSQPGPRWRMGWRKAWPWILYGIGVALGIYVFLYLALLVIAHAVILLAWRTPWHRLWGWLLAAALGVLAALPVITLAINERHQVAFLAHRAPVGLLEIGVDQWFFQWWIAIPGWLLVIAGLVLASIAWRRAFTTAPKARMRWLSSAPSILIVSLPWLILPNLLLWLLNRAVPVYAVRYMSFVTPALALLMGYALAKLPKWWQQFIAVVVLLAVLAPEYVYQRTPYAKSNGTDWQVVSETIMNDAQPGDAILFDPSTRPSRRPRLAEHLYPQYFSKVKDVELSQSFIDRKWLWDRQVPIAVGVTELQGYERVWVVEADLKSTWAIPELEHAGFTLVRDVPLNISRVLEFARG